MLTEIFKVLGQKKKKILDRGKDLYPFVSPSIFSKAFISTYIGYNTRKVICRPHSQLPVWLLYGKDCECLKNCVPSKQTPPL